jgi:lysophospholipase L1-like esterase
VTRRLVLMLAVTMAATGCTSPLLTRFRVARTAGNGSHVLLVGDSNLALAGRAVESVMQQRLTPTVDAQPGIATSDPRWATWLPGDLAQSRPRVVVVQLGTNDASVDRVKFLPAAIDRLMHVIPRNVPVLWSNVRIIQGVGLPWVVAELAADISLLGATARWPNLHLLDYAGHFANHPEWIPSTGVHLTPAGQVEYARWVTAQVAPYAR